MLGLRFSFFLLIFRCVCVCVFLCKYSMINCTFFQTQENEEIVKGELRLLIGHYAENKAQH